jgi:sugar phosphate isomerase/epimerase
LRETGYEGFLSVECLPKPDADEASERAIKFLRKIV